MRHAGAPLEGTLIGGRTIDNSQVVREVDPRHSRELWAMLLVVLLLCGGLGFYAWPHLAAQRASTHTQALQRERDELVEENRKLRLEKASLEDLRRVEKLAGARLGLYAPPAERVVVIEREAQPPPGARLASHGEEAGAAR